MTAAAQHGSIVIANVDGNASRQCAGCLREARRICRDRRAASAFRWTLFPGARPGRKWWSL